MGEESMNRVIVTDSTSDIPADLVASLGIKIIPVNLYLNQRTYKDFEELSAQAFYSNYDSYKTMSTGPVSFEDYALAYLQWVDQYDEVLIVHCSSKLSETINVSRQVHEKFSDRHQSRVEIIDSHLSGMGLGWIVIAAAEATRRQAPMGEVLKIVRDRVDGVVCYLGVPSLTYLRKNKKISGFKAFIGSAVGVKPILGFKDGSLAVKSNLFGNDLDIVNAIVNTCKKEVGDAPITISVSHAREKVLFKPLSIAIKNGFNCRRFLTTYFGPSIGISTGPETIGIAYYRHTQ
jgi:DegV family protein with EDD domain